MELDKTEVLSRPEIDRDNHDLNFVRLETDFADQYWDGGRCYIPVIYKGMSYKLKLRIKTICESD